MRILETDSLVLEKKRKWVEPACCIASAVRRAGKRFSQHHENDDLSKADDENKVMLQKPFVADELERVIREVLS